MSNQIKWLYEQLPMLVEKGILTEDAAERLRNHYGVLDTRPDYNRAFIIAGVLGAIMIGGGIILIFAFNWDNLSLTMRTICSFLPLVAAQLVYGYVYFRKRDSVAWVESSAGFLMLMLGSSLALISQTYNLGGNFDDFLLMWMLISIPLMYLTNASIPALFYMFGIFSWLVNTHAGEDKYYWALLLAALPHFFINIRPEETDTRARLLGWMLGITFFISYFYISHESNQFNSLLADSVVAAMIYLIGDHYYRGERMKDRPLQTLSYLIVFCYVIFISYSSGPTPDANRLSIFHPADGFYLGLFILALVISVYFLIYRFRKEWAVHFVLYFPFLVLLCILLSYPWTLVLSNLYLFGFGGYYVYRGIRERLMGEVNFGMLLISSVIIARFFDSDWNFIVKGFIFIAIGIGLLSVNVVLSRRLKKEGS